ncbi:F0F1 ATP synthase subunit epsilon [Gleimia europaea]|uniref:ATP synthase F1, epsilon subunit n=1 Tax=Gleimia europaea ACS-120-V-Col10b TaxID=883069 RepID=A0A9W5RE55_9ACTO|nr:F0F1 ATP synthase subunit epsilon [Gleimia europaea]EPD30746.1 ATP synthase F1, epsilon subunit [Gleimia europaea ACS-120-V-Col10b]
MAKSKMLQVEVVSRTEKLWHGLASSVVVPSVEGDLGVLVGRAPLLAVLRPGSVAIETESEGRKIVEVSGGFASVDSDFVTIVVEEGNFAQ